MAWGLGEESGEWRALVPSLSVKAENNSPFILVV